MLVELFFICLPFILFFLFQVAFPKYEKTLSFILLILIFSGLIYLNSLPYFVIFILGLLIGIFIEVILGLVVRTQHWENASFFGVPYWLPLVWGYGFVVIHQVGNIIFYYFK